jgi:hypothetical protein
MNVLLLCVLLLSGCAVTSATRLSLPPLHAQPVQAQFGLRFSRAGMSLPVQGAVQRPANEGSLGVIFPHGRTLGVCRYQEDGMECIPAEGTHAGTGFMLRQIGLGVYRVLPGLTQEAPQDMAEEDWDVRWKQAASGRSAEYRVPGSRVTIEMHFTEIARP